MKMPKPDNSGIEAAQRAQAQAAQAAANLQQNFSQDLTTDNMAQVVAGGTAADATVSTGGKRKAARAGLSSQLGIL